MYDMCFACGKDNPISLGLKFKEIAENRVRAEFVPGTNHQGYEGIMHGGLVTTLLDEAMVTAITKQGIEAVTAAMEIRFRRAAAIGEKLNITGYITGHKGRLITTTAYIENMEGKAVARAEGKFMRNN